MRRAVLGGLFGIALIGALFLNWSNVGAQLQRTAEEWTSTRINSGSTHDTAAAFKSGDPAPEAAVDANRGVALIIGNAKYRGEGQTLGNPENDANALRAKLRSLSETGELKWRIVDVRPDARQDTKESKANLTKQEMLKVLARFESEAAGAGIVLFFYAGHGAEIDGQNFLVPVNVDMEARDAVEADAVPLKVVLRALSRLSPKSRKIVILDACRTNPLHEETRRQGLARVPAPDVPPNTVIAFAAQPNTSAKDGLPGGTSRYTTALLNELDKSGARIEQVFSGTKKVVMEQTRKQEPHTDWYGWEFDRELVLNGPKAGAGAASAERSTTISAKLEQNRNIPEKLEPGVDPFADCDRCPAMVVVPAGSARVGSPDDEPQRQGNEGPVRKVTIPTAFLVSQFEVTVAQWNACVLDDRCRYRPDAQGSPAGHPDPTRLPVVNVSWKDADAYVQWLTQRTGRQYRLLSEVEWEYAARAGNSGARHWGEEIDCANANFKACQPTFGRGRAAPVGSSPANAWKLHDMLGNVWEWIADCKSPSYEGAPTDGTAWLDGDCASRGIRGGSWATAAKGVRAATRSFYPISGREPTIGFRVAASLERGNPHAGTKVAP